MAEKLMFSDIKEFKNEDFFNNHKTGKLYTDSGIYNIKIYTVNVLDSNKDIAYRITQYKNEKNEELIKSFENSSIFKNDIEITANDKFIMLTTCNGVGTPERAVLFCKLEKIETTANINEENNSDIDRDEKIKEKEEFERQKELESKKIQDELSKEEYKTKKNDKESEKIEKLKFYWEQQINNLRRLIIHILIFITVIIYIVLIIKKLKAKNKKGKKNKDRKREHFDIEQRNQRRIEELERANKLTSNEKNSSINKVNEEKNTKKSTRIFGSNKYLKKGKHSK